MGAMLLPNAGVRPLKSKSNSAQRLDPAEQILLVRHTGNLIPELAVLEEKQRWNRSDVKLERKALIFVHVNLGDLDRFGLFLRDLVQQWCNHLAGPAPFSP